METKSEISQKIIAGISINTKNIVAVAGAVAAIGMMIFFLIMRAFGLHYSIFLHFANLLFIFGAVAYVIRYHHTHEKDFGYIRELGRGLVTSIISAGLFSIFFAIYLASDPAFLTYLNNHMLLEWNMGPLTVAILLFAEGVAAGGVFGYIAMQRYTAEE